ncbi:heterokaryon incompatibility protein [Colletotrichum navitas]|uniref:Heterokaryon incompatibility protein n=1 Tax=Colletotrichum navitas TaxID=681940 RepID=A0AAD8PL14_9PEZI|nr:heterokaryon incompatibility protein [Colletotrichum navitas]KAK1566291.1 heterokaryon incompatibility protein [Colletotrichum navitas]
MECSICFNLGAQEVGGQLLSRNQRLVKFIQLGDLKQSAELQRCQECKLLWGALLLRKSDFTESELAGYIQLQFAPNSPLLLHGPVSLDIFSRETDGGPRHPTIGPAKEVESHSSAPSCLALASSWLQDCLANHPACKQASNQNLPTRVIDVGTAGLREPFLVETHGTSGAYVALSYCWGDPSVHPVLKTTHKNFVAHKTSIPHAGMPATLRDAVTIARYLGIRYLWVDALCIIQGDPDDWAREAGQMCEVYSNAAVTISADHADGNSVGVFARQAFGTPPQQLKLNGRPVYVRDNLKRKHNDVTILLRAIEKEGSHAEPINKRAWTLQEAILSNRTLHYTSNELVWECNTFRLCTCRREDPVELDEESLRCLRSPALFREMSTSRAYLQWRQIVQLFTERSISYDEDRLPALSGMAKQFGLMYEAANGKKDRYLAGLWEGDLATQLMWTSEDDYWRNPEIQYRRPKKWRAPSWSWAAVEGPVLFHPMSHFKQDFELLEMNVEALTQADLFGQVRKHAKLVIRGSLVHGLKITSHTAKPGDSLMGYVTGVRYEIVDTQGMGHTVIWDDASSVPAINTEEYTCLLIGKTSNKGDTHPYVGFLVLKRLSQEVNIFSRVAVSLRRSALDTKEEVGLFKSAKREVVTLL